VCVCGAGGGGGGVAMGVSGTCVCAWQLCELDKYSKYKGFSPGVATSKVRGVCVCIAVLP
jgi:hypothetical protein